MITSKQIRVLIMGLPGSGKTTIASRLQQTLEVIGYTTRWLNADSVRTLYKDWDFSSDGRTRQARRMRQLADEFDCEIVIIDMVAPTNELRAIIDPHKLIFVDTITKGRFSDTNAIFDPPGIFDIRVTEQDAAKWIPIIVASVTE